MTIHRNPVKRHSRPHPAGRFTGKPSASLRAGVILSLIGSLTGCMVGPDYVRPKTKLEPHWLDASNKHVKNHRPLDYKWWKKFKDPELDKLIEQAYQQNLPLRVSALRILQARAQLAIAIGQQYPQSQELFANIYGQKLSSGNPLGTGLDSPFINYQGGFDAAWELDLWGKFRRDARAAGADLGSSEAEYDASLVSLEAEVARTYTTIRTYQRLLDLTRQNIKTQEQGLKIAQAQFRHGATTELDVTQARTLLESTRTTVPQLQTTLRQAENALCVLLGKPPGAIDLSQKKPGIPAPSIDVAVGVPADLLRRRPDVIAAEFSAMAQANRVGVAEAELYPAFSLVGNIGLQTTSRSSGVTLGNSYFYQAGPSVSWPIFNYGRIKSAVRVQDAKLQQSLVTYQNTVLEAAREVEDALTGSLRAQEAAASAEKAVAAAQQSVKLSMVQYQEGAVDYQRVLDSERALLQEQTTLAQAHSDIATSRISLYKALGGGWQLRQGQPLLPEKTDHEMRQRTDWGDLLPAKAPQSPATQPAPTITDSAKQ